MAFEFIDDEPDPPTGAGFDFIDEPGGVEFLDEQGTPATDEQILKRVSKPDYVPTLAEFKLFRDAKERRPFSISRAIDTAVGAASEVGKDIVGFAKETFSGEGLLHPLDSAQSFAEGAARNFYNQGMLMRKIGGTETAEKLGVGYNRPWLEEDQFIAASVAAMNRAKFPNGFSDARQLITPQKLSKEEREKLKAQYRDYRDDAEYKHFLAERGYEQVANRAAQGEGNLVPEAVGKTNQKLAQGFSYIADPSLVLPAGAAARAPGLMDKAAAAIATQGGAAVEKSAGTVANIGKGTAQFAERMVEKTTGLTPGQIRVGASAMGGTSLLTPVGPAVVAGATTYGGLRAAEQAGKVAGAVGRALPQANERTGLFATMARDASAPEWLRKVSEKARLADPAVATIGAGGRGAAQGAAIGGAMGAMADGEEGFAAGVGSGGMLGGVGSTIGRMMSSRSRLFAAEEDDIARWISGKSADELSAIKAARFSRNDALRLADTERLVRGVVGEAGPDVRVVYLNDAQFRQQFGGSARGAQVIQGDTPAVFVNTEYRGPRSLFHEVSHALDAFAEFAPQRQQLNRILFDQTTGDGVVISEGLYSRADQALFEDQYVSRLPQTAKDEWRLLTEEQRQAKLQSELRAEHLANLIDGSRGNFLGRDLNSVRRRVADALLLAESGTFLASMRQGLEAVGVKFERDGAPSDMFTRHGKPITNSAEVNAALRDYLRAKDSVTKRLLADDAETGVAVHAEQFLKPSNRNLVEVFKDSDLFARNPDGSVKIVGGDPVKAEKSKTAAQASRAAYEQAKAEALAAEKSAQEAKELAANAATAEQVAGTTEKTSKDAVARQEARLIRLRARTAQKLARQREAEAKAKAKAAAAAEKAAKTAEVKAQTEAKFAGGLPVLLSESEIRRLQTKRVELMLNALDAVPPTGKAGVVTKNENGSYTGKFFSPEQVAALAVLPDDVLSPAMKAKLQTLNQFSAAQDGSQFMIDYNAALRRGKYSSGISMSTRQAVPIAMEISKAGNFLVTTLDTSHFFRKLQQWRKSKPGVFEPWQGDADLFLRDVFKYLDNHAKGLYGSDGLSPDKKMALLKKNIINDFFNVPQNADANPIRNNAKGDKDNLIRSRRFDRINRIVPGVGDRFPVDYDLLKQNYLPAATESAAPSPDNQRLPGNSALRRYERITNRHLKNEARRSKEARNRVLIKTVVPAAAAELKAAGFGS